MRFPSEHRFKKRDLVGGRSLDALPHLALKKRKQLEEEIVQELLGR